MKKKGYLKFKFISKYEVDFWGYLTSCSIGKRFFKKMFKIFCFKNRFRIPMVEYMLKKPFMKFNYSRMLEMKKKIKNYSKPYIAHLHNLLRFRIYYGDMTIKKFRKYIQRVNVRRIDFEIRICILLESRLDILLFRLNVIKTPRAGRHFIKCKKIKINNKIISKLNQQLYINDIISFKKKIAFKFYNNINMNLKINQILFNYPKYLEVNYNLMKCLFISYPKLKDIPTTWQFNLTFLKNLI